MKLVLAAAYGDEPGFFSRMFNAAVDNVGPIFDWVAGRMTDFYHERGLGAFIVLILIIVLALILFLFLLRMLRRFLKFLYRRIKRLFLKVTGKEQKAREQAEKRNQEAVARRSDFNNLLSFKNTSKMQTGVHFWEEEVAKAAAEISAASDVSREAEILSWENMISGASPYITKLAETEKALFELEDRIHAGINKITSLSKQELVMETAYLRVGLESLSRAGMQLKRLQAAFPEDTNIAALSELCDAFIQATKGVEKGFIAALAG